MKDKQVMDNEAEAMQEWSECGKCSDAHYHSMTEWLTSHPAKGSAESVYKTAMLYESALSRYLECLKTLPVSTEVERDVAKAFAYRSYLTSDIELLLPMLAEKRSEVFRRMPDLT